VKSQRPAHGHGDSADRPDWCAVAGAGGCARCTGRWGQRARPGGRRTHAGPGPGHAASAPRAPPRFPSACPATPPLLRPRRLRSTSPRASASRPARADACHSRRGGSAQRARGDRAGQSVDAAGPGPGKGAEAGAGGTRGPSLSGHRCPAPATSAGSG
jgi:hypothetical protein